MNAQQIFDKVVTHLAKQKQRSYDKDRIVCAYRLETGNKKKVLKCAVGCLIPKNSYTKDIEGQNVDTLKNMPYYFDDNQTLLMELQQAHDSDFFCIENKVEALKDEFREVAQRHKLDDSKVELITEWKIYDATN